MKISRRGFLKGASAAGVAASVSSMGLAGCSDDDSAAACGGQLQDGILAPKAYFAHGVASGDPLSDRVIIWTRVTPLAEQEQANGRADGEVDAGDIDVDYEVATDHLFEEVVSSGSVSTNVSLDYTVKVDVDGLESATTYFYRFSIPEETSIVGRTRTAPEADEVDRLRLAFCSCSSMAHGYFTLYRDLAQRVDLDAILHLGDYIYEYGNNQYPPKNQVRDYDPPHEIVTRDDYTRRYAWYRLDADLQAVHQQHPFICVWDDHESTDNSWRDGANNHQPDTEGDWATRKAAAQAVYSLWMPIRTDDPNRIYRKIQYGNLVDLLMLDTRLYGRDEQGGDSAAVDRTLLGEEQETWLGEQLSASTAKWKILGQQVMCGQLLLAGSPLNDDQWDGYEAARNLLFSQIENTPGGNVIVLTGDIHTAWAMDLTYDPTNPEAYNPETGEGSIAVEFVTSAISSPGLEALSAPGSVGQVIQNTIRTGNPHIKHFNLALRGYVILDIDDARVQADFYVIDRVDEPNGIVSWETSYFVADGTNRLQLAEASTEGRIFCDRSLAPTGTDEAAE